MKILMISTDKNILKENSEARRRMIEYGSLVDVLHIVVFTKRDANNMDSARLSAGETGMMRIANNVFIYSTNSRSRWFYIFDAVKIGKEIIQNSKFKIQNSAITAQDPFETGFVAFLISRIFSVKGGSASGGKIPLHLQIHTDVFSSYFKKESLLNRIRVLIAKFLIPRANCIRVVSQRIKRSLLRVMCCPLCITVLPIFVDVEKIRKTAAKIDLRQKYPQFDFIILMASRLTKEKNIGLAIEAMAEISKSQITNHKSILLLIVGEGPELKNLQLKTYNLQLENNVKFEPWTDDLISYYKTADLFLLTSNYEGYGQTIMEAMAAGCPVIMTDVGLAGEFLVDGQNGLIVEPDDKNALVRAIIRMIVNEDLRRKFAEKAYQGLSKLPNKEQTLALYRQSWEMAYRNK